MPRGTYSDFSGPVDEVGTTYVAGMRVMGHEMKETHEIVEVESLRLMNRWTSPPHNWLTL